MYASFQIELDENKSFPNPNMFLNSTSNRILSAPPSDNTRVLDYVKNQLSNYLIENERLDAVKIKKEWFPDLPACHVFISHSHRDVKLAKNFADWLNRKYGIVSFIDSEVWGYSEELLKKLDNRYSKHESGNGYYSYKKRNVSTAHVHTLLTTALLQMIDKTECLIFLNTSNSTTTKGILSDSTASTLSPWIYTEILASKILRQHKTREGISMEESISALRVNYTFPTDHLININCDDLLNLPDTGNAHTTLDALYKKYETESCK